MSRRLATTRHLLFAILGALIAFSIGTIVREPASRALFTPEFLTEWFRVGRVMRLVNTRYVDADKVPYAHLGRNAAAGASARVDRYSEYLDAEDYEVQNKHSGQLFTGIGVIMRQVDGLICIDRLLPGGGAEAAGLRAGDRIISAGGEDLSGVTMEEAGRKIKGPESTEVALVIRRPGAEAEIAAKVTRRTITVSTVSESRLLDDGRTGYILLSGFERRTPAEVHGTIETLRGAGATRLILDLRGNPGGLVDAAVGTVGLFCPESSLVVKFVGRTPDDAREYLTQGAPAHPRLPLAVLVDGTSASASEILAGALRDHGRAVLVGSRTFGKGLVQSIFQLDDTTGLKLTTARYALPKGSMIHGIGVAPDVDVPTSLSAGIRHAAEEAQLTHGGGTSEFVGRFGYTPAGDEPLRVATTLLALAAPAREK